MYGFNFLDENVIEYSKVDFNMFEYSRIELYMILEWIVT